jgi:hypothetical protein
LVRVPGHWEDEDVVDVVVVTGLVVLVAGLDTGLEVVVDVLVRDVAGLVVVVLVTPAETARHCE